MGIIVENGPVEDGHFPAGHVLHWRTNNLYWPCLKALRPKITHDLTFRKQKGSAGLMVVILERHLYVKPSELGHMSGNTSWLMGAKKVTWQEHKRGPQGKSRELSASKTAVFFWCHITTMNKHGGCKVCTALCGNYSGIPMQARPNMAVSSVPGWPVSEGLLRSKDRAHLKDSRPRLVIWSRHYWELVAEALAQCNPWKMLTPNYRKSKRTLRSRTAKHHCEITCGP